MAKEGSTVSGLMDTFATTVSLALQYGVPLRTSSTSSPTSGSSRAGFTGNQEIPIAKSIVDYIFRWLGSRFLSPEEKVDARPPATAAEGGEPPAGGFGAGAAAFLGLGPSAVADRSGARSGAARSRPQPPNPRREATAVAPSPRPPTGTGGHRDQRPRPRGAANGDRPSPPTATAAAAPPRSP